MPQATVATIDPPSLHARMAERPRRVCVLDVREAGEAERGHVPGATSLPRRLLEFRIATLLPDRAAPIVVYDGADGRAALAAHALAQAGYHDISVLTGGLPAWIAAGLPVATGFNVPSKAFGEHVLHTESVPSMPAPDFAALAASGRPHTLWDVRTPAEYRQATLPGSTSNPGFEMALHAADAPSDAPLVVHCAGRTRSIIAARTLRLLGFANAVAVENGTMGWALDGRALERGAHRAPPAPSARSVALVSERARALALAAGVAAMPAAEAARESAPRYVFDVRPGSAFQAAHADGAVHAPGGQLIQCTDEYVAIPALPILLMDDGDARAFMAAYWLRRMGFPDVRVVEGGLPAWTAAGGAMASGPQRSRPAGLAAAQRAVTFVAPEDLCATPARALVLDVGTSRDFAAGHVPGALWLPRGWLEARLPDLPDDRPLVATARDERQAVFAAAAAASCGRTLLVLRGGNGGWQAAGGTLEPGAADVPGFGADVVEPPYAQGEAAMRRYIEWETRLKA